MREKRGLPVPTPDEPRVDIERFQTFERTLSPVRGPSHEQTNCGPRVNECPHAKAVRKTIEASNAFNRDQMARWYYWSAVLRDEPDEFDRIRKCIGGLPPVPPPKERIVLPVAERFASPQGYAAAHSVRDMRERGLI
jgi:hypothetical protein